MCRARKVIGLCETSAYLRRFSILLVPSGACLPFTKPTWSRPMREGVTFINRLAKILAYIFRTEFNREISLKFWGDEGSFPDFGSVNITAWSISFGKDPIEAALLKISASLGAKIGRKALLKIWQKKHPLQVTYVWEVMGAFSFWTVGLSTEGSQIPCKKLSISTSVG